MEWFDLLSNEDLKPKVEVAGNADGLTVRLGKTLCDKMNWKEGAVRVQYAESAGRAFARVLRDPTADWALQSAGKGGGLLLRCRQLAPQAAFTGQMCSIDSESSGALVVSLPHDYALANGSMRKPRRAMRRPNADRQV
ncbi:hypothetical protein [Asticcacaulis excentricus]|uniref:Uncharacterized protein n=1 Tax=Asticcacaulis excentricus (strain ATCC 15261 / DSM 4724 / KCTC 12464 / NCIMB 9791 / VKM B-1370 / CB 48) TaxID=573065 RepID=E8RVY9_ASTEC|nr:hypothetical protein [Asticcacaulis excentricus]ADU15411.1 hypothetical protein Astex_3801 [Asticcacaulis excentricus CB 48]